MKSEITNNRLTLVNYFIKKEGYKPQKTQNNDEISYLYNSNAKIKIIRIKATSGDGDFRNDAIIDDIAKKSKNASREKIEILWIYLDNSTNIKDETVESDIKIFGDKNNLVTKLKPFFANIDKLKFSDKKADDEIIVDLKDQEQVKKLIEDLDDKNSDVSKKFQEFHNKIQGGQLIGTWIATALFSFVPILIFLYLTFFSGGVVGFDPDSIKLFAGGTNFNLTILGGQFWRVFTYGFSGATGSLITDFIIIGINFYALKKLSSYTENLIGALKMMVIIFVGYIICGLIFSILIPSKVFGGPIVISAILFGALLIKVSGKHDVISILTKKEMIYPGFFIFMFPLFELNESTYWVISAGFCVGMGLSIILNSNYKDGFSGRLFSGYFIVATFLFLPLIMLLVPTYIPAMHNSTINSLGMYIQRGFLKVEMANEIIGKIGWKSQFIIDGDNLVLVSI
ncbi:rhomboid family intramembrane serine protease [Spiroplasma endosymbiont of Panorpa germanica]|uniref:rhomboid family intramembrane serine protease n=1 Tax=Spiroplasma endosymbiont of Panorpa germanica TaxID=3066314 RepID=UPI0030CB445D